MRRHRSDAGAYGKAKLLFKGQVELYRVLETQRSRRNARSCCRANHHGANEIVGEQIPFLPSSISISLRSKIRLQDRLPDTPLSSSFWRRHLQRPTSQHHSQLLSLNAGRQKESAAVLIQPDPKTAQDLIAHDTPVSDLQPLEKLLGES